MLERSQLSANVAAFCGVLRRDHGFGIGQRETHDALRALDVLGLADRTRVRTALRLVCCAAPEQRPVFDHAFDAFFEAGRPGLPQALHAPRHTRPSREQPAGNEGRPKARRYGPEPEREEPGGSRAVEKPSAELSGNADGWHALRARYSPASARGTRLVLDTALAASLRGAARELVANVRLGRSRRWTASRTGGRFDIRRTLRASLETGGDPAEPRFLAHPLRNPRFVVLIDGSRSMAGHTAAITAFAAALCERSARAHAFVFSTALREVTRELRDAMSRGTDLAALGEAWGGGTKIGTNLARFVSDYGPHLLSPDTLTIIFSDGLDAGDIPQLERALREIDRRSAGIVWLNPHAAAPGFTPSARGMQAARRYIMLLDCADDPRGFARLTARIGRLPRLRGRRR